MMRHAFMRHAFASCAFTRYAFIFAALFLAFLALTSASFAQNAAQDAGNVTHLNATTEAPANLQGIWILDLGGMQITMALEQSGEPGETLSGRCKFEGDLPWNGVIAGSVSGRAAHIAMAAMRGEVLVSTGIIGTADGDSLQGSFVTSDAEGVMGTGSVTVTRISADTSTYTPIDLAGQAEVPFVASVQSAPTVEETETTPEAIFSEATSTSEQPSVQVGRSAQKFNDVRQLARGIDPNIMPRSYPL